MRDYREEYQCVLQTLSDGLQARLIDGDRWYKDNQYLYYEDPHSRASGTTGRLPAVGQSQFKAHRL